MQLTPTIVPRRAGRANAPSTSSDRRIPTEEHPLGPLFRRLAARRPRRARALALVVFAAAATLLVLARRLDPDPSGVGTHRQLGFAPCLPVVLFGYPCPTCGMTTAFAHAVRGQWLAAFQAQPAGLAIALSVVAAGALALNVALTGKVWEPNWYRLTPGRVGCGIMLLILSGWGYKLLTGWLKGSLPYR